MSRANDSSRLLRKLLHGPAGSAALTVILLVPSVNKAYHMDDTLFLQVAEQVRSHALDPFGFEYNWHERPEPMAEVTQNPPLGGYLLAAVQLVAGESEPPAHLIYLAIALGCAVLMHALAGRFCRHPGLAVAAVLVTPGFFVSASNVMADIPLLFFWLLAVWLTLWAAETGRTSWLWMAGFAASVCAMTKYFGAALVPLLMIYWILRVRRLSLQHATAMLLPLITLFLWGTYTLERYGTFHPLQAAGFSVEGQSAPLLLTQTWHTLVYFGGSTVWPLVLAAAVLRAPPWLRIAMYALIGFAVADAWLKTDLLTDWSRFDGLTTALVASMGLAGVLILGVASDAWRTRRDADSTLLLLWLVGTVSFSAAFNWTVNVRILLPALLPAALLVIRRLEQFDEPQRQLRRLRWSLWPTAVVALAVGWTDYEYAGAGRDFARTTLRDLVATGESVNFTGHLGYQFYAEQEGALPLDVVKRAVRQGDLLVQPGPNMQALVAGILTKTEKEFRYESPLGLHTHGFRAQAGFYTYYAGPVPYNVAPELPLATFEVDRVIGVP